VNNSSCILWLTSLGFSTHLRSLLTPYLETAGINPATTYFISLERDVGTPLLKKKDKTLTKLIVNQAVVPKVLTRLAHYLATINPSVIVINDEAILQVLVGKSPSLSVARSSTYPLTIGAWSGHAVVIDDCLKLNYINKPVKPWERDTPAANAQLWWEWCLAQDLAKVARWNSGTQRAQPKFDYTIVRDQQDLTDFLGWMIFCKYISIDIETAYELITCIGFTGLTETGDIKSFCIPFIDPSQPETNSPAFWWIPEHEEAVWKSIRAILADPRHVKIFQNGTYDCSYLLRYRCPPTNYILDTYHLMHSIWSEAPKSLYFIASLACDHYQYWKDEAKAESTLDRTKSERIPFAARDLERYWRYNCLDTYYTLLSALWLLRNATSPTHQYSLPNYATEFSLAIGPSLLMSMTGLRASSDRQAAKYVSGIRSAEAALTELRIMVDDAEFNPNSVPDVSWLLYDVLQCPIIKKRGKNSGRSTAEPILRILATKHPVYAWYIEKIWEIKKHKNNASKYGQLKLYQPEGADHGRFKYKLNPAGTLTGRFGSSQDNFGYGSNAQNVPGSQRDICTADPGYILFEPDYSQSDGYYTAYALRDNKMQEVLNDPRDTHCLNASEFFGQPYDEIYNGYIHDEPWVVHPTYGLRQLQKRISYGANYLMAGFTLYVTMGHDSVVAAAKALGYTQASQWTQGSLIDFCDEMLTRYWLQYNEAKENLYRLIEQAIEDGNLYECPFGLTRKFFGDLNDDSMRRQFASQIGQGGTAGAINRTLLDAFQSSWYQFQEQGLMLMTQTHDSILVQIPVDRLDLCNEFMNVMTQPCTLYDKTFTVPIEAKIGFSWGNGMIKYNPNLTPEETLTKCYIREGKLEEKYNVRTHDHEVPTPHRTHAQLPIPPVASNPPQLRLHHQAAD